MGHPVLTGAAGERALLLGNEAFARGLLEAGVHFASGYPGTPSSEIIQVLGRAAKMWAQEENGRQLHVEWSTNEKVAAEAAAAASWAGLRAVATMKGPGLAVILDFLTNLILTGSGKGGLVYFVADDPGAHSSTNEQDSRSLGRFAEVPMLEASDPQAAKEVMSLAFDLSERYRLPLIVRSSTRLGHSRADVVLGELNYEPRQAAFDYETPFHPLPRPNLKHKALHETLAQLAAELEDRARELNPYEGPEKPELLVVCGGTGYLYGREAIEALEVSNRVGLLKISTLFPLPENYLKAQLARAPEVLFLEEVDPYLEKECRSLAVELDGKLPRFRGKLSGELRAWGELDPDTVQGALIQALGLEPPTVSSEYLALSSDIGQQVPGRMITFCPGCQHLASFWAILRAVKRNKGQGFVTGDIGCYTLGVFHHDVVRTVHAMGSGAGLASGFGQLGRFGLKEPVISVIGDSTFFHAGIPPLVNLVYNNADATYIVLDNSATAMTGFQGHPGSGSDALGEPATKLAIENFIRAVGIEQVEVVDPFDLKRAVAVVYKAITSKGQQAIIFRRGCSLVDLGELKRSGKLPYYWVDQEVCVGTKCSICVDQYHCVAWVWDPEADKSTIDEVLCTLCSACVKICPHKAVKEYASVQEFLAAQGAEHEGHTVIAGGGLDFTGGGGP